MKKKYSQWLASKGAGPRTADDILMSGSVSYSFGDGILCLLDNGIWSVAAEADDDGLHVGCHDSGREGSENESERDFHLRR